MVHEVLVTFLIDIFFFFVFVVNGFLLPPLSGPTTTKKYVECLFQITLKSHKNLTFVAEISAMAGEGGGGGAVMRLKYLDSLLSTKNVYAKLFKLCERRKLAFSFSKTSPTVPRTVAGFLFALI